MGVTPDIPPEHFENFTNKHCFSTTFKDFGVFFDLKMYTTRQRYDRLFPGAFFHIHFDIHIHIHYEHPYCIWELNWDPQNLEITGTLGGKGQSPL